MFWEIFLFEIKYRLSRLDTYLYFVGFFLLTFFSFVFGNVPDPYSCQVNAPISVTLFFSIVSLFMMVVTASVMGSPIYRDIEYATHEYYLSYPLTKNGYFWGRFLGSFLFVVLIATSLIWGSWLGVLLGPKLGWLPANRVGPFHLTSYLQPFFAFLIPNLLLTSSIFFGLVAYTRNIKIIYSGGIILYLAYMMGLFIFNHLDNKNLIYYLDAFGFNALRLIVSDTPPKQINTLIVSWTGKILINRALWTFIGLSILMITYWRFSFIRFFGFHSGKKVKTGTLFPSPASIKTIPVVASHFTGSYNRKILFTLSRIEILNIFRDFYFRLIMAVGIFFLGFIFFMGFGRWYGVVDFPRTVMYMDIYVHNFLLFIFLILLFYTGESLHREKATRFSLINDSLPPRNWLFYSAKFIALSVVALFLASIPIFLGVIIQIAKGYHDFHFAIYFAECFLITLPMFIEMICFCFCVHVIINNKFAAHAIALTVYVLMLAAYITHQWNYFLWMYSYTPGYSLSDMDGIGPTIKPLVWFNLYWIFGGGLLMVLAAVFYYRGVLSSFAERVRLARARFNRQTRITTVLLLIAFLGMGAYNYFNLSYLNTFLTPTEKDLRAIAFEKTLKKHEHDPLPAVVYLKMIVDIFPDQRKAITRALVTLVNKTNHPINTLLLDGDELAEYSIRCNGKEMPFTNALIYPRAKLSLFKPALDTSMYRIYRFPDPLKPGDTVILSLNSTTGYNGFTNDETGTALLRNGTFFNGGLPGMGYDEDEEMGERKRADYGMPEKEAEFPPKNNQEGLYQTITHNQGMTGFEATISTSGNQVVVAPGHLENQWTSEGRNYFHYVLKKPAAYYGFPILSAGYTILRDSVKLTDGKNVNINIFYFKNHSSNLDRFMAMSKDGLVYFSKSFGAYPFDEFSIVETAPYIIRESFPNLIASGEEYQWNARFESPDQFDYVYYFSSFLLAQQWWKHELSPNHTLGANNIAEGVAKYCALMLMEKKKGKDNIKQYLHDESDYYIWRHRYPFLKEKVLANSNDGYIWENKMAIFLYGLKDLIGEDSLNSALRRFYEHWAYRDKGPFAGNDDLFEYIKKVVPDSLQYYLSDGLSNITVYDNKILEAKLKPLTKPNEYSLQIKVSVAKFYSDTAYIETPAKEMNDYIDVGVFGVDTKGKDGRSLRNPIYFHKYRFPAGEHEINLIVKEKPSSVGIDPYEKLIDKNTNDNIFYLPVDKTH